MQYFLLVFKHIMIIVLISLDLRALLNIFGVNYPFAVRFPIGHLNNKVKDKEYIHVFWNEYAIYFIE